MTRTCDIFITSEVLYQLSYRGGVRVFIYPMGRVRFELTNSEREVLQTPCVDRLHIYPMRETGLEPVSPLEATAFKAQCLPVSSLSQGITLIRMLAMGHSTQHTDSL